MKDLLASKIPFKFIRVTVDRHGNKIIEAAELQRVSELTLHPLAEPPKKSTPVWDALLYTSCVTLGSYLGWHLTHWI
jgi:hypothetical protein